MTATIVESDVDLTTIEALDFEPCCQAFFQGEACEQTAEWLIVRTPCPNCDRSVVLFCTEDKEHALTLHRKPAHCPICFTVIFNEVFRVEALR